MTIRLQEGAKGFDGVKPLVCWLAIFLVVEPLGLAKPLDLLKADH